jgi:hypothetical protein
MECKTDVGELVFSAKKSYLARIRLPKVLNNSQEIDITLDRTTQFRWFFALLQLTVISLSLIFIFAIAY